MAGYEEGEIPSALQSLCGKHPVSFIFSFRHPKGRPKANPNGKRDLTPELPSWEKIWEKKACLSSKSGKQFRLPLLPNSLCKSGVLAKATFGKRTAKPGLR
ncbi:UNVERIFIED_CONTAM: hypothetical protein K2H54_033422 [Gekko kuhli]